jgi:sugar phosphate permease
MTKRWLIFGLACSLFFLSQFYRVSNAVIAPQLLGDLAIDTKGLGLISASFFYAFALTQIPISLLLDKVGPRSMMTTYKLLTLWFSPRAFAGLAGLVVALGTAGNMVATTPLVILVGQVGWRSSFQLIAVINLILTLFFYLIVRDSPAQNSTKSTAATMDIQQAFGNLRLLLTQKDFWIISFGTFARYGIFAAFQALWAGPYLMEAMGYSALTTGNLILLLNVGMILGAPCWGTVSDRLLNTRKWIIVAGSGSILLTIIILAVIPPGTPLPVFSVLFFCFGFFNATGLLMYPHIKELVPPEMSGAAMTGINFFTMIGPAVVLQGLGVLMQTLYPNNSRGPEAFNAAFVVCIICLLLVLVSYCFTKEKGLEG